MFASEFGTPVDPRNILRTIQVAAQKAGMSDIGVHTLRHSAAVAWLETGVHIKAVADLLGHSSIAITGDIYGHTSDTRHGQQLRAWPDSSVSWTNQPLLSIPLGGMKKAANDFCDCL